MRLAPRRGDTSGLTQLRPGQAVLLMVLTICALVMFRSAAPAQDADCPQMHQCLVSCTLLPLEGATVDQFNGCQDECLQVENCVEGQVSHSPIMTNARTCSKLQGCLSTCADTALEGAEDNDIFTCNDQCFADTGNCVPQAEAATQSVSPEAVSRYEAYVDAVAKVKSVADLVAIIDSKRAAELQAAPAEEQKMAVEFMQIFSQNRTDVKVIGESTLDGRSIIMAEYCSQDGAKGTHTVTFILENGDWKVEKDATDESSDPCVDSPNAAACTDDAQADLTDRLSVLLDAHPEAERNKIYQDSSEAAMNKMNGQCRGGYYCDCLKVQIEFLEAM